MRWLSATSTESSREWTCVHAEALQEPLTGAIEGDESVFGDYRKGERGWGAGGKVLVMGIVQRNGQVKGFPIPARKAAEVINPVCAHTTPGSLYNTDDWQAYASLWVQGDHIVVPKEKGRPKGRDHINGIEGFWSYAKNWLNPYRGVPRKYFHLYLAEICYRFNHRKQDLKPLAANVATQNNRHRHQTHFGPVRPGITKYFMEPRTAACQRLGKL